MLDWRQQSLSSTCVTLSKVHICWEVWFIYFEKCADLSWNCSASRHNQWHWTWQNYMINVSLNICDHSAQTCNLLWIHLKNDS